MKVLMDEKQYELSKINGIPISRAALSKLEDGVLEYANSPKADNEFFLIIGNMIVTSERRLKFTKDDMKDFEKIIESCSHFDTADASIDLILIEEMPPYFLGQKDLPAVIKIISDRVQKVLDERGT